MAKHVYTFGAGMAEGKADMKNLLGGKGANLAEMNLIGVPVPPGFTITTEVCTMYNEKGQEAAFNLIKPEVEAAVALVEKLTGTVFGDKENPCLVSVRSGARASMPGMIASIPTPKNPAGCASATRPASAASGARTISASCMPSTIKPDSICSRCVHDRCPLRMCFSNS